MARLHVPHHPERVFKDDWWDQNDHTSPSGYRALPTDTDPLEAFAVMLESDSERGEVLLASRIITLGDPSIRVESFRHNGWVAESDRVL